MGWKRKPSSRAAAISAADQVAGAARMQVQVVGGGRAAAQGKLAQAHPGGYVRRLLVEAAPHRIQGAQPGEQVAGQCRGERARQVLVQVVVGVDQARRHQAAGWRRSPASAAGSRPGGPSALIMPSRIATQPPAISRRSASIVTSSLCTAHAQVGAFVAHSSHPSAPVRFPYPNAVVNAACSVAPDCGTIVAGTAPVRTGGIDEGYAGQEFPGSGRRGTRLLHRQSRHRRRHPRAR